MKKQADLVRGWIKKAQSDMLAMTASRDAGAIDACCFHAQQAAEKFLKAYLLFQNVEFPFTHNLVKLIHLAAQKDTFFDTMEDVGIELTPYAVELRYDQEFWPDEETAEQACNLADMVRQVVMDRLPADMKS